MAVPVSDRRDSNSGGRSGRLTAKSEVAVVMTTCCHPSTLAFQSFTALEQPSWLPHGRHLEPGAPPGAFNSFLADGDATTGDNPDYDDLDVQQTLHESSETEVQKKINIFRPDVE